MSEKFFEYEKYLMHLLWVKCLEILQIVLVETEFFFIQGFDGCLDRSLKFGTDLFRFVIGLIGKLL